MNASRWMYLRERHTTQSRRFTVNFTVCQHLPRHGPQRQHIDKVLIQVWSRRFPYKQQPPVSLNCTIVVDITAEEIHPSTTKMATAAVMSSASNGMVSSRKRNGPSRRLVLATFVVDIALDDGVTAFLYMTDLILRCHPNPHPPPPNSSSLQTFTTAVLQTDCKVERCRGTRGEGHRPRPVPRGEEP